MKSYVPDARAYLAALRWMFEVEMVARVEDFDGITAIHYTAPILHPTPREFSFHTEFLAPDQPADAVVSTIDAHLPPGEEHVLTAFSTTPDAIVAAYAPHGYVHAWTGVLMVLDLEQGTAPRPVANPAISPRRVTTVDDLEAGDLLEAFSPSPRRLLDEAKFNAFIADLNDYVVAKGRLITVDDTYGHICRLFTEPVSRHQGAATAILNAIHERARLLGLRRLVLMPSKSARASGLFEKFGYRDVASMVVMVPAQPSSP